MTFDKVWCGYSTIAMYARFANFHLNSFDSYVVGIVFSNLIAEPVIFSAIFGYDALQFSNRHIVWLEFRNDFLSISHKCFSCLRNCRNLAFSMTKRFEMAFFDALFFSKYRIDCLIPFETIFLPFLPAMTVTDSEFTSITRHA